MQRTHFKNHRLRTKMTELTRELMAMSPMCIVLLGAVENQQKNSDIQITVSKINVTISKVFIH